MTAHASTGRQTCRQTTTTQRTRRWTSIALLLIVAAGIGTYTTLAGVRSQLAQLGASFDALSPPPRAAAPIRSASREGPPETLAVVDPTMAAEPENYRRIALPSQQGPLVPVEELPAEHWPAEAAVPSIRVDSATFRLKLDELLAADPQALEQAHAMLDEPDPIARAENFRLLQDTFGVGTFGIE